MQPKVDAIPIPEVARRLNISVAAAYRWCADGSLPAVRLGRRWIMPVDRYERFLRGDTTPKRLTDVPSAHQ